MKQDTVVKILKQKNAEIAEQFGVKSLFALQDYLEKLLCCSVDLGTPDSLKPYIREHVMGQLIRVT